MRFEALIGFADNCVGVGSVVEKENGVDAVFADYCGFAHAGDLVEDLLDIFREDFQSFGCGDHFLLAAADREVTFAVEFADVAGVEPSIFFEGGLGCFGRFEVAFGDVAAADDDFAVAGDFDFDSGEGFADGSSADVEGMA